jgi:hypothetical protein
VSLYVISVGDGNRKLDVLVDAGGEVYVDPGLAGGITQMTDDLLRNGFGSVWASIALPAQGCRHSIKVGAAWLHAAEWA